MGSEAPLLHCPTSPMVTPSHCSIGVPGLQFKDTPPIVLLVRLSLICMSVLQSLTRPGFILRLGTTNPSEHEAIPTSRSRHPELSATRLSPPLTKTSTSVPSGAMVNRKAPARSSGPRTAILEPSGDQAATLLKAPISTSMGSSMGDERTGDPSKFAMHTVSHVNIMRVPSGDQETLSTQRRISRSNGGRPMDRGAEMKATSRSSEPSGAAVKRETPLSWGLANAIRSPLGDQEGALRASDILVRFEPSSMTT